MTDDWTLADHIEAIASILTDGGTCPTPPLDVNSGLIMNMLDAAAELRRLERWKSEAMNVMAEWDEVFDALGRPGTLGASKAASSLAEVERLKAAVPVVDDATRQEVDEDALNADLDALEDWEGSLRTNVRNRVTAGFNVTGQGELADLLVRTHRWIAAAYLGESDK